MKVVQTYGHICWRRYARRKFFRHTIQMRSWNSINRRAQRSLCVGAGSPQNMSKSRMCRPIHRKNCKLVLDELFWCASVGVTLWENRFSWMYKTHNTELSMSSSMRILARESNTYSLNSMYGNKKESFIWQQNLILTIIRFIYTGKYSFKFN